MDLLMDFLDETRGTIEPKYDQISDTQVDVLINKILQVLIINERIIGYDYLFKHFFSSIFLRTLILIVLIFYSSLYF